MQTESISELQWQFDSYLEFFVKDGRAVLYPVYSGTYDRRSEIAEEDTWAGKGHEHTYTQSLIRWGKDFRRSIDYLETRSDISRNKIAYCGISWGGEMGLLIPAVEDRINVVILFLGGFPDTPIPEADVPNYTPHIKVPTLMLNGMYDVFYPLETSVRPAFDFLGTPKDQKRLVVYETDHYIPTREMVRESLIWLDRYLGPVKMPP